MLLFHHSWMFYNYSNFISFLGTNLLTQCPVLVAVFCLFFTSQKINIKRSPNAAKLFVEFLWTRRHPVGQRSTWGCPEGGTAHQGAPGGPGTPRWVVPTSVASRTPSLPYKFPNILKTLGVNPDQKFCRCKALSYRKPI